VILALVFLLQGGVMAVDEIYCHRRRGLARWERLGHPLDTLTFIACLGFLLLTDPTLLHVKLYTALTIFSCVFITKDEWEHRGRSISAFENWLHALLFVLHPIVLIVAGWMWWSGEAEFRALTTTAVAAGLGFMLYQTIYWNRFAAET
jgi:hypothetical protein